MKKRLFVLGVASLLALMGCNNSKNSSTNSSFESVSVTDSSSLSEEESFTIKIETSNFAILHCDHTEAKFGEQVVLTYELEENCVLLSVKMNDTELKEDSEHRFVFEMPKENVVITYEAKLTHEVEFVSSHASASLKGDKTRFYEGETVLFSVDKVDEDYTFDRFEIKDLKNNVISYTHVEDLVYSFEMPDDKVTITAIAELTKYDITLPSSLPQGIEFMLVNNKVLPEEMVSLYVKNDVKEEKRIVSVSKDGTPLEGKATNEKNVTLYTFEMPKNAVVITAEIIDVYVVSLKEELQDILALEGNLIAAEGEQVEFTPVFYKDNYWAKKFKAVEQDVEVVPSSKQGYFTFTMPNHAVTIDAEIGKIGHAVIFDKESSYYSIELKDDTTDGIYKEGDEVKVKVTPKNINDTKITGLKVNDSLFEELDDEGYYTFTMLDENVTLDPVLEFNYKEIVVDQFEGFTFTVTTFKDDQEVTWENNVLSNQDITINVSQLDLETSAYTLLGFRVYYGEDENNTSVSSTKLTSNDDKYTYKVQEDHYYRFEPIVVKKSYSTEEIVGEYEAGYRPYWEKNYPFTFSETGSINCSDMGASISNKTVYVDPQNENHYTFDGGSSYIGQIFYNGNGTMLVVNSDTRGNTYLLTKGHGNIDIDQSFSYYSLIPESTTIISKQFINMVTTDGTNVTALYDYVLNKVYFNPTMEVISGTDGKTLNDEVLIKDNQDNVLALFKITKISSKGDGYQHAAVEESLDSYAGNYTPFAEEDGTDNLLVTGYGKVKIGENTYSYTLEDNILCVEIEGVTKYYVLNKEDFTYKKSLGPTDSYEGTYSLDGQDVVLDGYGNATKGEETFTYEIKNDKYLVLTSSTSEITYYLIDKDSFTLTQIEELLNPYVDKTYEAAFDFNSLKCKAIITFTSETECDFKYTKEDGGYPTVHSCKGTYEIKDGGIVTINITKVTGAKLSFDLQDNGQGALIMLQEEVIGNGYSIPVNAKFEVK